MYIFYFYIYVIVALDYSATLYSSPRGGTGVPCPSLCDLVAPSLDLFCGGLPLFGFPVPASAVCARVVEGLGRFRGWDGVGWGRGVDGFCIPLGALT